MSQYISKDDFRIFQNHSFYSDIGTHNLIIMDEGVDEGLYEREIQLFSAKNLTNFIPITDLHLK